MIVLDLACATGHRFEGWFASLAAFETQLESGQISCPVCADPHVRRRLNAPRLNLGSSPPPSATARNAPSPAQWRAALRQLARQAEDVGERLADEARQIHRGESAARPIRGQVSQDQLVDLLDEGIPLLPVPPDEALH